MRLIINSKGRLEEVYYSLMDRMLLALRTFSTIRKTINKLDSKIAHLETLNEKTTFSH